MRDEVFREPLEMADRMFLYDWTEHPLVRMQWRYLLDWPEGGSGPRIWVTSYTCWQRRTTDAPFEEADNLPFDVPMSPSILHRLTAHAGRELYRRSLVVGSMKSVPENFFERAAEAAEKGYSMALLRDMSQKEVASAPSPERLPEDAPV